MEKIRKTINVSLQSRKYCGPMNDLINKWEEDGNNLSIQICENLLKWNEIQQSPTMLRVINMFDLITKSLELYNMKDEAKIEDVLSKVIKFDASGLNEIFLTMNQLQDTKISNNENIVTPIQPIVKNVEPTVQPKIEQSKNLIVEPKIEEVPIPTQEEFDIPMDFLMNG